jgi:hypothetical protein
MNDLEQSVRQTLSARVSHLTDERLDADGRSRHHRDGGHGSSCCRSPPQPPSWLRWYSAEP